MAFDSGTMFKKKSAKERKAQAKPPSNQLPLMGSLQNGMQQEKRSGNSSREVMHSSPAPRSPMMVSKREGKKEGKELL